MLECIQNEFKKIFGVELSSSCCIRSILMLLGAYGVAILLFAATSAMPFFSIFFVPVVWLASAALGIFSTIIGVYYAVYFGRKAWIRASNAK
jgi:hypothetical protein